MLSEHQKELIIYSTLVSNRKQRCAPAHPPTRLPVNHLRNALPFVIFCALCYSVLWDFFLVYFGPLSRSRQKNQKRTKQLNTKTKKSRFVGKGLGLRLPCCLKRVFLVSIFLVVLGISVRFFPQSWEPRTSCFCLRQNQKSKV